MRFVLTILFAGLLVVGAAKTAPSPAGACRKSKVFSAQSVDAWSTPSRTRAFFYKSGLAVDADGAFRAYHPDDASGLDSLDHAGQKGNWWALVTDNGKPDGRPVVQKKSDPAPGYYVSTTALYDPRNGNIRDPHRYVDAAKIPYVVLHPEALKHARLGDFATVLNLRNGKMSVAIVADASAPDLPVGEGSIALANALGINSSAREGGQVRDVVYVIYPRSGNGRPRPLAVILAKSKRLFAAWGGSTKLNACVSE